MKERKKQQNKIDFSHHLITLHHLVYASTHHLLFKKMSFNFLLNYTEFVCQSFHDFRSKYVNLLSK